MWPWLWKGSRSSSNRKRIKSNQILFRRSLQSTTEMLCWIFFSFSIFPPNPAILSSHFWKYFSQLALTFLALLCHCYFCSTSAVIRSVRRICSKRSSLHRKQNFCTWNIKIFLTNAWGKKKEKVQRWKRNVEPLSLLCIRPWSLLMALMELTLMRKMKWWRVLPIFEAAAATVEGSQKYHEWQNYGYPFSYYVYCQ